MVTLDAKSKHLNRIVKTLQELTTFRINSLSKENPARNCLGIATAARIRIQRALSSFDVLCECQWPLQDDLLQLQIWRPVSDLKDKACLQSSNQEGRG